MRFGVYWKVDGKGREEKRDVRSYKLRVVER